MSKLVDRQAKFLLNVCKVIQFATDLGYQVTIGEAERTPEQAEIYAKKGIGVKDSKHCERLAIDLNYYRAEKLVNDRVSLEAVGCYAESLGLIWGGRFKKYDDSRHLQSK